jgi:hypothetical protein
LPVQELGEEEYSKEFQPASCDLRSFDAVGFDKCMAGRRLIIVGDSLMRQMFQSLACLNNDVRRASFSPKLLRATHQAPCALSAS